VLHLNSISGTAAARVKKNPGFLKNPTWQVLGFIGFFAGFLNFSVQC